jgi:hypothetical protein
VASKVSPFAYRHDQYDRVNLVSVGVTYWCANFLWDLTSYSVSIAFCMIIFLAFNIEAYVSQINCLCLLLLLFLYGFAIIPLMYPISYLFESPSTGFVLISCVNIFIGLITTISTFTLETFNDEADLVRINSILMKLFLIFPHYCLGRGLFDMSRTHVVNVVSAKYSMLQSSCYREDIAAWYFVCSCWLCAEITLSNEYCRSKPYGVVYRGHCLFYPCYSSSIPILHT